MILHLPLDDFTEDKRVLDSSGKSHPGTLKGNPSLLPDEQFGACLRLNGQTDYVEVADSPDLKMTGDLTLSAWIYLDSEPGDWVRIIGKGNANERNYGLWYHAAANVWLFQQYGTGGGHVNFQVDNAGDIVAGKWYHIVCTRSNNKGTLILDGKELGSIDNMIATPYTTNDPLTLGYATYHTFHNGKIAQARVYDRALSLEEVQKVMVEDQTAMATFHETHPLDFNFQNDDQQEVLFIDEAPEGHQMTLILENTSRQNIQLAGVVNPDASESLHHFALHFRPGTLLEESLDKIKVIREKGWSMKMIKKGGGDVFIYILATHAPKIEAGKTLSVQFTGLRPDGQKGSRGTRVELFYNAMSYEGKTSQIQGQRIAHLNIVNHKGKKNIPLHAGFHGSNKILNDAVNDNSGTANKVVFHLTNALPYDSGKPLQSNISLKGKNAERPSKFFLSFDAQQQGESTKDWALGTLNQVSKIQIKVSLVNIRVDNGVRKVSNPIVQVQNAKPGDEITLLNDVTLESGAFLEFEISNIKSSLPAGLANLYLHYENIPGYWDGQIVDVVEKSPLVYKKSNAGFDRVGIGTSNPQARLHVIGGGGGSIDFIVNGRMKSDNNDGGLWVSGDRFVGGHSASEIGFWNGNAWRLSVQANGQVNVSNNMQVGGKVDVLGALQANGRVGLGGVNTGKGFLEIPGTIYRNMPGHPQYGNRIHWIEYHGSGIRTTPVGQNYAIYTGTTIAAWGFYAHSDARLKDVHGLSNPTEDLNTLMSIQITDYKMRDQVKNSSGAQKKVIGQQLAKVFPQAVSKNLTETVPDIYQRAEVVDGWIVLDTDLQSGERIRIITEENDEIYDVLKTESTRFKVALPDTADKVFVYGREVNDFHSVDYEAISMLNVSATQEQQRLIEKLDRSIEQIKADYQRAVNNLESRLQALEGEGIESLK